MTKKLIKVGMHRMGEDRPFDRYFHLFFQSFPELFDLYDFEMSETPDYLFCGSYSIPKTNAVKIYYSNEGRSPNLVDTDWAFGCDYEDQVKNPKYFRQPYYVRLGAGRDLVKGDINVKSIMKQKTKFCNFIYHHVTEPRDMFFKALSKYKRIDSPGSFNNNMPPTGGHDSVHTARFSSNVKVFDEKLEFISPYKFTIAFSNRNYPGYTDEKIYHPMLVNSIPIHWGNHLVHRDFNPKSFINAHDCPDSTNRFDRRMIEYLVSRVVELDKNDDLYAKMLKEPWYYNNKPSAVVNRQRILTRFQMIFQ